MGTRSTATSDSSVARGSGRVSWTHCVTGSASVRGVCTNRQHFNGLLPPKLPSLNFCNRMRYSSRSAALPPDLYALGMVLRYTARVVRKAKMTMEEILFSLKQD